MYELSFLSLSFDMFYSSLFLDRIIGLIGQGTYGKVVKCFDVFTSRFVAIKVIRAIQKYRVSAKNEIEILSLLQVKDRICSK